MIPLIHIFGNEDLSCDNLPPRLLSHLKKRFPNYRFLITDPNELDLPTDALPFVALDTVEGLKEPRDISIDEIATSKTRTTAHDFDFASFLLLAKKLHPHLRVRLFGIPMGYPEKKALHATIKFLESLTEENATRNSYTDHRHE